MDVNDNKWYIRAQRVKKSLADVADFFNFQVVLKSIIQALAVVWKPLLIDMWGKQLLFLDTNGKWTTWGYIAGAFVYLSAVSITILSNLKSARDAKRLKTQDLDIRPYVSRIELLEAVAAGEIFFELQNMDIIRSKIGTGVFPPNFMRDLINGAFRPHERLHQISDQLKRCLAKVSTVKETEIVVSMAVSVDLKEWNWAYSADLSGHTALKDLLSNENSSFFQVHSGKTLYFFANDKLKAIENSTYLPTGRDTSTKNEGSIICWDVTLSELGQPVSRLILSISTYGKKLTDNIEKEASIYEDIRRTILKQWENPIRQCLFHMRYLVVENSTG